MSKTSSSDDPIKGLPENAFRELKPGEEYVPVVPEHKSIPDVTVWSVLWGVLMAVIFSAAAAYLGLKVGQVFEAAIPIAIIAAGLSSATKRKNSLHENVIIQSIGSASGVVVAGAIFTLPAIYILQEKYPEMTVNFLQIFISSLLGGVLGILLLIPFRKYFVKEMHGKYPFPEATATSQVLISAEKGGAQAKPLLLAGIIGGLYDFLVSTLGLWHEEISSRMVSMGNAIADKAKLIFNINTGAAVLGLGFIIGLKYSFIICAGSFLIWYIIVPAMSLIYPDTLLTFGDPNITVPVGSMSPEEIFKIYARNIGIGGIATAGIIGIIKSRKIIVSALGLAAKEMKSKPEASAGTVVAAEKRIDKDIPMKIIAWGTILALGVTGIFFYLGVVQNLMHAVVALLLVAVIAFLFTTVAANATAIVGSNPVSGMTLMTLILASLILGVVGLKGPHGMVSALIIGGVVCTALSMAGGFITDLKVGYWLGVSPKSQESWKFLGTLVSAATVGGVIMVLNKTYGFTSGALAAPQANAMAALIEPMMQGASAKWALYGIGAAIALVLNFAKVPTLPFALGMFIPLQLNTPLLVGGLVSWFVGSRSKNSDLNKERVEKGTLIASGFIAGGALMGVVSAILRYYEVNIFQTEWNANPWSQALTVLMYFAIIFFFVKISLRVKSKH